ncbi:hypothetical protein UCRPC4_g05364 [Phaeomoniella chlamydospora]|uniref:Uncharacterized protein n=1 Tax=Phaeomoniella chlamydospora TaxID=158046 RepID=A0A0G2E5U6_PHACM|nr:hypothetical protein UCRPC4_g05364 [Phaeomoniella chlamydospora]
MPIGSFKRLGISARNPESLKFSQIKSEGSMGSANGIPVLTSHLPADQTVVQIGQSLLGTTPLLTPPDDVDSIKWNKAVTQQNANKNADLKARTKARTAVAGGVDLSNSDEKPPIPPPLEQQRSDQASSVEPSHGSAEGSSDAEEQAQNALESGIRSNVASLVDRHSHGITVISQTLPHPLQDSPNAPTAFTSTIESIQSRFDGQGHPPYIRITHAVPPKFTLVNLPSSPPGTPIRQGGDDYFSMNIFASAAPVPNYYLHDGNVDRTAPPSPAPIVPPSSVQVALIERYIPPSTAEEYTGFFSRNGPSVLVDRLIELSPDGGSLMLIYPTRKGAETFRAHYVAPLLDSLLRTLVVVHDMRSDFASSLGRMPAIRHMLDVNGLKERLNLLCHQLSRPSSSPSNRSEYSLEFAESGEVPLDRAAWSEWFLEQETPRMKAALKSYWQRGQKLPTSRDGVIPPTLMREIQVCVEKGKYEGPEPQSGIEVGVFVIRRTR